MYRSPDHEGCCDRGFRLQDNRCVGCAYGLRYTKCKHQCTLYCDSFRNEPFLNCSRLSESFFDVCEPGCVCPPDQFETVDGECVFFEEICEDVIRPTPTEPAIIISSTTCTNPDMSYDECPPCMATCRNFMTDVVCAAVCTPGCRCNDGLVMDESTSNCTLPANCTVLPSLPQNAVWGCCEGDCDQPFTMKCKTCEFGPKCMPGFVRDRYRNCVDLQYCDSSCSEKEIYDECPFESTCLFDNDGRDATTCVPGCRCKGGYLRDHISGECILPVDCPVSCVNAYEIPGCSACVKSCATLSSSADCSTCQRLDTCVCDAGYVRNSNGDCVSDTTCNVQCDASRNEVVMCSECVSTCDNSLANCNSPPGCTLACGCDDGYVLNTAIGECVRPSSCPVCTDCVSTDNNQNYKQAQCLPLLCYASDKVTYTVRFVGTWESSSHPDFGFLFSHWSPLTGASHRPSYEIWENCFKNVTTGVRNVAERGDPRRIIQEYATHPDDVLDTINDGRLLPGNGGITRDLDVNKHFHYITLLSMMGDTKDYMVGVDRLDMCDASRTGWKDYVRVCLSLYSAGTKTVLETGCAAHGRQFANCSFGYIELRKNPVETQCTGDNEERTSCLGLCDKRCEQIGGTPVCPRICQAGCNCISGYARNEREECVPEAQCSNSRHQPNQDCGVSQWMDSAIAVYPNDTVKRIQMRYVTQRPTRKYSGYTCPSENTRAIDYCEEDTRLSSIDGTGRGHAWVDTHHKTCLDLYKLCCLL